MKVGPSARQRGGSTANSLWVSLGVSGVLVGLGGSYSVANTQSRMALCEVGVSVAQLNPVVPSTLPGDLQEWHVPRGEPCSRRTDGNPDLQNRACVCSHHHRSGPCAHGSVPT